MKPIRRWLGSLLAPAEDPRHGAVVASSTPDVLLDELRRSRGELAQLRQQIASRAADNIVTQQLAEEERELAEAEASLMLQLDEGAGASGAAAGNGGANPRAMTGRA